MDVQISKFLKKMFIFMKKLGMLKSLVNFTGFILKNLKETKNTFWMMLTFFNS